jgi:HTH-type transcriptional regulator, bacterioopsin transcriptional activator and related proteins
MNPGSLTDALQKTLAVFSGSGEPQTTPEVAECLDLGRRSTYARLERLVEQDWLETKKVGANARVWWRNPTDAENTSFAHPIAKEFVGKSSQQRDFFQRILDAIPVGILVLEPDGTFTAMNQQAIELLEVETNTDGTYTIDIKRVYNENNEPLDPNECPYGRVFETGDPIWNWQSQIKSSDGDCRWFSINIEPINDEEDDIECAFVTIGDITRPKYEATRLEHQRNKFASELEEVLGRITDAFYALDAEWQFTYLNKRAEELIAREEDLIGENIWERFNWAAQSKLREEYERAMEFQEPVSFELYYPEPFGGWYEVHVYPSKTGLSVYFRDITDRKERKNELEMYETILSTVDDGIYVLDEDYCFIEVNEAYAKMTGYECDELLGAHCSLVVDDEIAAESAELVEQLESGVRESASLEADIHRMDGSRLRTESSFAVLSSDSIEGAWKVGVVRDISDRVDRERILRESEQQYRSLVENFPNGAVGLFDEDLRYTAVGGELLDQLDISPDEPIGEYIYDRYPDDIVSQIEPYFEAALDGESGSLEVEYYGRDLFVSITPVMDEDEVFSGMLLVQDITERREREHQLERRREQLAALNDLNSIVNDITETIINQSTREKIEQTVCEALSSASAYEFAWLAEVDSTTDTIKPRIVAGTNGYEEQISISTDPGTPGSRGPGATAIREQEIQIIQNVFSDPSFEPWRDAAAEYGFNSVAAIPIVHEGTVYGVLGVYADRPNAFDSAEQEVISQLGEVVGHAIAATERKQALLSDELVELEFQIHDIFDAFDVPVKMSGTVSLNHTVQLGDDEFILYGTASSGTIDPLTRLVEVLPHWESITVRSEGTPTSFELRLADPPVLSAVASLGGYIEQAIIEDTDLHLTVHLAPSTDIRQIIDLVESAYPHAEMRRRQQITCSHDRMPANRAWSLSDLTERQRAALKASYYAGFFAWPRETTGEEVAESLGIAPATFHQHLRSAERKVFDSLLSTGIQAVDK